MSKEKLNTNRVSAYGNDTYHSRFAPDRKHNRGSKKYKPLKKKCVKCGTTSGQLDIDHIDGNRKNNKRSNLRYMCRSCHRSRHDGKGYEEIISSAARIINDPNTPASQQIAKAHQNEDLMHVEFILCHNNVNANKDYFSSEDMKANASTAINKPINWEHSTRNIGVIYESKFVSVNDISEADASYYGDVDPLKEDFIVCKAAIWEYKHPEESRIMRSRHEAGNLYFSMENKFGMAKCSDCKETFSSVYEYCDHLLTRRNKESNAHREFVNSNFIGAGTVSGPADKGAKTLALAEEDGNKPILYSLELITPEAYANYLISGGNMRKGIEIPEEYQTEIENEFCADDINGHFPLDTVENIKVTAETLISDQSAVANYDESEIIYMLERTARAAKQYEVNLKDIFTGGNMNKDIEQTQEFKSALKEAVAEELKKTEQGKQLQDLSKSIDEATATINELKKKMKEKEDEKAKADQELEDYKKSVEAEQAAKARVADLQKEGFSFSENTEKIVFSCAAALDEKNFESFKNLLTEVRENAVAETKKMTDEEKKKMEEEKKKKKDDKSYASDIVEQSKASDVTALASVSDPDVSFANKLDTIFTEYEKRERPAVKEVK